MNINIAIGLFFIVTVIYLFIITIITALFRINGLPKYLAKFQTISLLTNSGYTTAESELMLTSKKRRQICNRTMLFGYIFSATFISLIVNLAMTIPQTTLSHLNGFTIIMSALFCVAVVILTRPKIKNAISHALEKAYEKNIKKQNINSLNVIDIFGENAIIKIYLNKKDFSVSKKILENKNVKVLYSSESSSNKENYSFGEMLTVMGKRNDIEKCFE